MAQFMLVSGMVAFSDTLIFGMEAGRVGTGSGKDRNIGSEGNRLLVF